MVLQIGLQSNVIGQLPLVGHDLNLAGEFIGKAYNTDFIASLTNLGAAERQWPVASTDWYDKGVQTRRSSTRLAPPPTSANRAERSWAFFRFTNDATAKATVAGRPGDGNHADGWKGDQHGRANGDHFRRRHGCHGDRRLCQRRRHRHHRHQSGIGLHLRTNGYDSAASGPSENTAAATITTPARSAFRWTRSTASCRSTWTSPAPTRTQPASISAWEACR